MLWSAKKRQEIRTKYTVATGLPVEGFFGYIITLTTRAMLSERTYWYRW